MQSSKLFLAVCAAGICIGPLAVRGEDTEAQAKARQALEQKLNELQPQPATQPPAQPPVAKPTKKKATPPSEPAPMREPPPIRVAPPTTPPPPAVATEPQPVVVTPAPPSTPPLSYQWYSNAPPKSAVVAAPPAADPEAMAKMREALERKLNELQGQEIQAQPQPGPAAEPTTPRVAMKPATPPYKPAKPTDHMSFKSLPSPESPLTADKQQRLAVLLQKYKADQITPEQYHEERAKILNEQ